MGGPTVVAGQTIPGGITYSNIESVNLELGKGDNHLTVANTSDGSTNVTTGNGDNTIDVQTIVGQTSITTGTGDDTINVDNSRSVLQLGGLLTIDTGGGNDTVNVDDSGVTVATNGTLTGSTLTGLAPLTVAEEQTIVVQAAGGTYTLLLPNALPGHGSIQLDYIHDNAATVQAALRTAYGTTDIDVTEVDDLDDEDVHRHLRRRARRPGLRPDHVGGLVDADDAGDRLVHAHRPELRRRHPDRPGRRDRAHDRAAGDLQDDRGDRDRNRHAERLLRHLQRLARRPRLQPADGRGHRVGRAGDAARAGARRLGKRDARRRCATGRPRPSATTSRRSTSAAPRARSSSTSSCRTRRACSRTTMTGSIPVTATAADLLAALSTVLNPNNVNPALPFTDNVAVEKHGSTFTITYQGSMKTQSIAYIDTSGITNGHVTVANRASGIDYYNVGTLNIDLGSGDDVFNVQGTTATTNLSTAAGDDRIYVSSGANVGLSDFPSFISGTLDNLHGTLNIDAGTGNQTLMISAEGSNVGDTNALITRSYATVHAASPTTTLTPTADLFLTGFAPAGISITAAAAGNFGGGITIWTGSGDDHITVDATHFRAGVNEVTTLNTGLGNDNVTVNLTDGVDGAFVLDAQGPDENLLHLSTPGPDRRLQHARGHRRRQPRRLARSPPTSSSSTRRSTRSASWSARSRARQAVVTLIKPTVTRFTLGASHTVSLGTALQNLGPNEHRSARPSTAPRSTRRR